MKGISVAAGVSAGRFIAVVAAPNALAGIVTSALEQFWTAGGHECAPQGPWGGTTGKKEPGTLPKDSIPRDSTMFDNPAALIGSLLFGAIGFAAFMYGKKMALWKPLVLGLVLMVYLPLRWWMWQASRGQLET